MSKPELKQSLEFLGYSFAIDDIIGSDAAKPRSVDVAPAASKIRRYKTRIVVAFLDFFRKPDYELLVARLRFLSENRLLKSPTNRGRLKTGIFFNYTLIDDPLVFLDLNIFLKRLVYAKAGSFGVKVAGALTAKQKKELTLISFVAGYRQKRTHKIKPKEARAIRACWGR